MFLHLFDDEKFVDVAINLFESASSGIHTYVVLLDVGVEKPTLVKSKNIEIYYYENNNTIELVKIEGKYKGIFVHYLNKKKAELIQSILKSTKLIWMIWGGDAYPLLDEPLLQKSYFNQQKLIYSFFQKSKLKNAIYSSFFLFEIWKLKRRNEQQFIIDTIKKFTHFFSMLINEEILFRKYLPLQSAKYMPFNYANTHQLLGDFVDRKIKGKKILIGNSGDPSNNHLEIFNKLKDDQRFSKS